MTHRCSAYKR